MSLAARCTHCHTVFRITGAQLAAAQGWVRCGGCSQVFDAASNLVTPSGQALEVPTVTTPDSTPAPVAAPLTAAPFQAMPDIDLELPDLGALKAEANATSPERPVEAKAPIEQRESAAPAARAPLPEPEPAPQSSDQREPFWVDGSRTAAAEQHHQDDVRAADSPERIAPPFDTSADLRGDMALDPSANKADKPSATGNPAEPKSNRLTGMAIVLLTLTLAALMAYAARGHIAQAWPEARPLVLQVCATLGCQLPAVRHLEAVNVQGSSLSRDDTSGHHRLRIQLLNTDEAPVLMPAFDLTLVDAQGEALARRMIDPLEFQPALTQLDPGAEAALTVTMDLRALDSASVSSFRLSAYYP